MMIALSLRPLVRDTRALANDARRLTRLAEAELANMAGRTRDIADGTEVLTSDLANELHALRAQTDALEQRVLAEQPVMAAQVTVAAAVAEPEDDPMGRQPVGSVQSPARTGGRADRMKDSGLGSFLAGLAIGGLIGAALGMLLSPASGEEMREQVGEFVDERRAAFDDAVNEGRAAAEKARAEMLGAYDASAPAEGEAASQGGAAPEGAA